jgi:hypothetical protein
LADVCVNHTVDFFQAANGTNLPGDTYVSTEWAAIGLVFSSLGGFGTRP